MTDEVAIIDRVQVDVAGVGDLNTYAAIPVSEPLHAVYAGTGRGRSHTREVYGFTASGDPLVLNDDGTRLVPAWKENGQRYRVERPDNPPLRGPFSAAPAGMFAVFHDGRRMPVVFYDVHGRAVLIGNDDDRSLYLAVEDTEFARIEGGPIAEP